ncbi:TldD/PmbA family protein [Mariniphaga sediminis]|uniref:TldD/PmbA family protein n=1 Tax=Mariniphaga sediminis TaxID=1628158 RepID=UPI00356AC054
MTKQEKYNLAKWAISHALENGAQQVSVSISNSRSSSVEVREEKIDKLEQAIQSNLSIQLFVDKKYSSHSTNRLKKEELAGFIEEAIAGTRYLSEDEFRTLPDPELYYKGNGQDLKTLDTGFDTYDPQRKIDLAFQAEKEVRGKDERIISVSASYYDGMNERVMVTSNGFEGDMANSYYGLHAQVSVKGGDARPEASWSENAIFYEKLKKAGIGQKALDRALKKIGQEKVESGKMDMIVENRMISRLFGPLISALNGSAIQQKNSFLVDRLGEKVFSEKLTVTDDPFIIFGRGSRLFDGEGLATKKRLVFESGVVRNYYIDTYYGKKLNMEPTGGSNTNLVFKTGGKDLDGLVSTVEKGILVTGFNGGNCNGSTGDFSYGIEGFFIEKGQLKQPVSEMNITGNMKELWSNIGEIGNDVNENSSWLTPSVLFSGVDFSGA